MGTNFYWHDDALACPNACAHCANSSVIHVGKRSMGWSFGFRGWPDRDDFTGSPFGFPVMSRNDWREVFKRPGRLVNEYGLEEADPLAWLDELEPPSLELIRNEVRWADGHVWDRDAEGFRITTIEFS